MHSLKSEAEPNLSFIHIMFIITCQKFQKNADSLPYTTAYK